MRQESHILSQILSQICNRVLYSGFCNHHKETLSKICISFKSDIRNLYIIHTFQNQESITRLLINYDDGLLKCAIFYL